VCISPGDSWVSASAENVYGTLRAFTPRMWIPMVSRPEEEAMHLAILCCTVITIKHSYSQPENRPEERISSTRIQAVNRQKKKERQRVRDYLKGPGKYYLSCLSSSISHIPHLEKNQWLELRRASPNFRTHCTKPYVNLITSKTAHGANKAENTRLPHRKRNVQHSQQQ
jgi:hypothetical protein